MKAIKYLIIDAVLVSCLIAYNAAPGITDMLETLPKELVIGVYLALLLTSIASIKYLDYHQVMEAQSLSFCMSTEILQVLY